MTNKNPVDIYLYSRPVGPLKPLGNVAPQHLFIIMDYGKDANGDPILTCIRGGPKRNDDGTEDKYLGMLRKDLEVTIASYEDGHVDYDEHYKTLPHVLISHVDRSQADKMVEEALHFATSINDAGLDYKLPLTSLPGGGQNSNTIARYIVQDLWDVEFKLPTYPIPDPLFTQLGGLQIDIPPLLFVASSAKMPTHLYVSAPGVNEPELHLSF